MKSASATSNKFLLISFAFFCIALCLISFYHSLNKPFTLDEVDITNRANMVVSHGPKGPFLIFEGSPGEAMPHPPLYEYTIALIFRVFGETESNARAFGILCFAIVGFCLCKMLWFFLKDENSYIRNLMIGIGLCIFLSSPLIIQHALLVDADGAYTFLFISVFTYFFIRSEQPFSSKYVRSRFPLALILAVTYLSKEYTPFFLSFGILGYRLLNREWKKLVVDFVCIFILGLGIACGVWIIFSYLTGIDPLIFIKQQYAHRLSKMDQRQIVQQVFWKNATSNLTTVLRWPIYWGTTPFHLLTATVALSRLVSFIKKWRLELIDYCLLTACIIWVPYLLVKPSVDMMKYQHPVYALLILVVSVSLCRWLRPVASDFEELFRKNMWLIPSIIILIAAGTFYYFKMGDYLKLLFQPKDSYQWKNFVMEYYKPFFLIWALGLILQRKYFFPILALSTTLLIFPIQFALNLHQTAPYTTVESWLNYGESGLRETAEYLSTRVKPGMNTCMRKDLIYYLRVKYKVEPALNHDSVYIFDPQKMHKMFSEALQGRPFVYLVLDQASILSNSSPGPDGQKLLSLYKKDANFGTFVILKWNGDQKLRSFFQ